MLVVIDSVILLDDKPMNCHILLNYPLLLWAISDAVRFYWRQFECIALLLIYFFIPMSTNMVNKDRNKRQNVCIRKQVVT